VGFTATRAPLFLPRVVFPSLLEVTVLRTNNNYLRLGAFVDNFLVAVFIAVYFPGASDELFLRKTIVVAISIVATFCAGVPVEKIIGARIKSSMLMATDSHWSEHTDVSRLREIVGVSVDFVSSC
jgi:hypothetical protein